MSPRNSQKMAPSLSSRAKAGLMMCQIHRLPPRGNTRNLASLVESNDAANLDVLWDRYCAAHGRWCSAKAERARIAAWGAYRKWVLAFLGEENAGPVLASAEQAWGSAMTTRQLANEPEGDTEPPHSIEPEQYLLGAILITA